jgi:hypothetical protein
MALGSQMANLIGGPPPAAAVLGESNPKPAQMAPKISSVFPEEKTMAQINAAPAGGPPDTSAMSHKERVLAMKAYRTSQENGGAALAPTIQKQFTAGRNDGLTHTSESSIGDRPSSRVLAPPGGRSTFTLG